MTETNSFIIEDAGYIQKRIWIDRSIGKHSDYSVACQYTFSKTVVYDRLSEVVFKLQQAHEILRTVIILDEDIIQQKIYKDPQSRLQWIDSATSPIDYVESEANKVKYSYSHRPSVSYFAFGNSSQEISSIVLLADHCLVDEDSFEIIRRDLELLLNRQDIDYTDRLQYSDFVAWESQAFSNRKTFENSSASRSIDQARECPSVVLRKDSQTTKSSGRRESYLHIYDKNKSSFVIGKIPKLGFTYFQVFLKILQISLCRWRCVTESLVASPITKRIHPEFATVVGPLLSIECYEHKQEPSHSFNQELNLLKSEFLKRLRLIDLITEKNPFIEQDTDPIQLAPEVFLTVNSHPDAARIGGLDSDGEGSLIKVYTTPLELTNKSAGILLLSVSIDDKNEQIAIQAKYDPDLFEDFEIRSLINDIDLLSSILLKHPDDIISGVVTAAGHRQWMAQKRSLSNDETAFLSTKQTTSEILNIFMRLATDQGDQLAIIDRGCGEEQGKFLTYNSLWTDVLNIASYLKGRGFHSGQYVGICINSLSLFVTSFIACWRLGCVCIPLDHESLSLKDDISQDYPLADYWIVSDNICLHTQEFVSESQLKHILEKPLTSGGSSLSLINEIDFASYVMYTSGTTGKPKAVMIPASGILKLAHEFKSRGWDHNTTVICASNRGFDASTFEIWATLLNAGTIVQASKVELVDPFRLESLIRQFKVSAAWLTKSVFDLVIQINPKTLTGLTDLIIGGEVLTPRFVERFLTLPGNTTRVWNGYGPTETTTFATIDRLRLNDDDYLCKIYIGNPVFANTIYVLGTDMELVSTGAIGEICIGGAGLAVSYVDDPEATEKSFLPDPYSDLPNQKIYRTGDFVQVVAPDKLIFLGRRDNLVKLKGFRVSLQTVKEIILQIDGVIDVAVMLQRTTDVDQLVAFVKREPENRVTTVTIREYMSRHSASYMIPSIIEFVEAIPINRNGKTDYHALIAMNKGSTSMESSDIEYSGSKISLAKNVLQVWKRVLGLRSLETQANLYISGADSLAFVRACILLGKLGISVTPQDIIGSISVDEQINIIADLADAQAKARNKPSSISSYQLLLDSFLAKHTDRHAVLFTSFLVDDDYDAIAIGMALFRIVALQPSLCLYRNNIDEDTQRSDRIQPISIIRLPENIGFQSLERSVESTIVQDLASNDCNLRVYVAHGSAKNLVIIGINNLVCGIEQLAAIRYKLSCWLNDRSNVSWSWSLDSYLTESLLDTTLHLKEKPSLKLMWTDTQRYSSEFSPPRFEIRQVAIIVSQAIEFAVQQAQVDFDNIFLITDGFTSAFQSTESSQPSQILRIAAYHEFSVLNKTQRHETILSRMQDHDPNHGNSLHESSGRSNHSKSQTSRVNSQDLLIVVDRMEGISVLRDFCWKDVLGEDSKLHIASISVYKGELFLTIAEDRVTLPGNESKSCVMPANERYSGLLGIVRDFNSTSGEIKVTCVSPLIGDVSCYRSIANAAQGKLSLSALYIANQEQFPDSNNYIDVLTDLCCEMLMRDPPDVLLGYSFGGILAASTANKMLERHDLLPSLVIVDTLNPYELKKHGHVFPDYNLDSWMNRVLDMRLKLSGSSVSEILRPQSVKSHDDLAFTAQSMIELGALPPGSSSKSLYNYLRHGLEQYWAYVGYTPPKIYNSSLLVSASEQDPDIENAFKTIDELLLLGWSQNLVGKKTSIQLTGDHMSIVHGSFSTQNAQRIVDAIMRLQAI